MKSLEFVKLLKEYAEISLSELLDGSDDFCLGQKYAYVDVLEMLQGKLEESERVKYGLDYNIEGRYPLK